MRVDGATAARYLHQVCSQGLPSLTLSDLEQVRSRGSRAGGRQAGARDVGSNAAALLAMFAQQPQPRSGSGSGTVDWGSSCQAPGAAAAEGGQQPALGRQASSNLNDGSDHGPHTHRGTQGLSLELQPVLPDGFGCTEAGPGPATAPGPAPAGAGVPFTDVIGQAGEVFVFRTFSELLPGFDSSCWRSSGRVALGLPPPSPDPPYDFW